METMTKKKAYRSKGVWIPHNVWKDPQLPWHEKVLVSLILSFQRNNRTCYATNKWFSENACIAKRTVSSSISRLRDLGVVDVNITDGVDRVIWVKPEYLESAEWPEDYEGFELPSHRSEETHTIAIKPKEHSVATVSVEYGVVEHGTIADESMEVLHETTTNKKKTIKEQKKGTKEVYNPFGCEDFVFLWEEWLADRRARKIKPYSPRGEKMMITKLHTACGGDVSKARDIVEYSIMNAYQGLILDNAKTKPNKGFDRRNFDVDQLNDFINQR